MSANRNSRQRVRFEPQRTSGGGRIDAGFSPPCRFIARPMDLAMVSPAKRDGKLIAHLTAQRAALRKAQVMGIGGLAAADQTRLLGHVSNVLAVTNPTRFRQRQHALIDYAGSLPLFASIRTARFLRAIRFLRRCVCSIGREHRELCTESLLDARG